MKAFSMIKRISRVKAGYIALLIFIWAAIGFISGLIIGRLIWLLQIL